MLAIRSRRVRSACLVLVSVACAARVSRGHTGAPELTLTDAVQRALREGAEARIARLESDRADDVLGQARSAYWPQAGVSSKAGWSNRQNDTLDALDGPPPPQGNGQVKRYPLSTLGSDQSWLSLYVDQIIFDLSRWRNIERTELEAEVATVVEAQQREQISFTVLQRYLDVLRLERAEAVDATALREAEWLDHQAALLLDSGRAVPSEREQVALHLEETRHERDERSAALEAARSALAEAIGEPCAEATAWQLAPESVPAATPPDVDAAADAALRSAPDLRILDLRRRMEDISVAAARAERLPTLSVHGGYNHYGTKRFDSFEDEVAVGVDLRLPVFDGFRTSNAIEGASKAAEAARLRYESVRDSKRARVRELVRKLTAQQQQPALAAKRLALARERLRLADLSLQSQRGSLADALTARQTATRDARAAIDAELDRVVVWATLQRETGRLAAALVGDVPTAQP